MLAGGQSAARRAAHSRIRRVLSRIEACFDRPHRPGDLAPVAGLSPSHLRSEFRRAVGESLGRYERRLRIARAAAALRYTDQTVAEVARRCGFASREGFARAFERAAGLTPGAFRRRTAAEAADDVVLPADGGQVLEYGPLGERRRLAVRFVERPPLRVALVRYVGPAALAWRAWPTLLRRARRHGLLVPGAVFAGLNFDEALADRRIRYQAAIGVGPDFRAEDLELGELPGGLLAVTTYRGPLPGLLAHWDIFARWLPRSGYRPRCMVGFDLYRAPPELWTRPLATLQRLLRAVEAELCMAVEPGPFEL